MFYKQNHLIDIRFSLKYSDGNRSGHAMHLKSPKFQNDSNYNVFSPKSDVLGGPQEGPFGIK